MAQQQQNITISAPGFQGLNTEDSPLQQDPGFALVADNCVIDKYGRIGSREAFATLTTNDTVAYAINAGMASERKDIKQLGGGSIAGTRYNLGIASHLQFDAVGSKIQEDYYVVLIDGENMTSISYPTLADSTALGKAKIIAYHDAIYIFSSGNITLKFNGTTLTNLMATGIPPQDDTGIIAANLDGDVVCSAYGRLWVAGVNYDYNTIYYSDLLIDNQWYDGKAVPTDSFNTAGIIDVSEYWPNGSDRIVAVEAHNNFLVVFGRQSILLYSSGNNFSDPADVDGLVLQDAISSMGAVSRDAVVNIGAELLYVDDSGVRGLGRTIQEKSVPLGDLTANVKRDISTLIRDEPNEAISLFYMPNKNLVICNFAQTEQAYAIEMRAPSATGGNKITRWTNCTFNRGFFVEDNEQSYVLLAGKDSGGVLEYDNYLEWTGEPYTMKYHSNAFSFGDAVRQKFVKQVDFTCVSSFIDAPATVKWGYSGTLDYVANKTIIAQQPSLFNVAYYNQTDKYGKGLTTLKRYRTNTKGSGELVRVALETEIAGNSLSIQEINIQTLMGRIY